MKYKLRKPKNKKELLKTIEVLIKIFDLTITEERFMELEPGDQSYFDQAVDTKKVKIIIPKVEKRPN